MSEQILTAQELDTIRCSWKDSRTGVFGDTGNDIYKLLKALELVRVTMLMAGIVSHWVSCERRPLKPYSHEEAERRFWNCQREACLKVSQALRDTGGEVGNGSANS